MWKNMFAIIKSRDVIFLFYITGNVEDDIEGNTERITVGDFEPIVGPTMDYVA
jgi:hypothetical protein